MDLGLPPAAAAPLASQNEPHNSGLQARLNWLRAGVLGANDGIISIAGLVVGVAAATSDRKAILIAGFAALVAGAVSMALGEYVSVSSARDTERALIAMEKQELADEPEAELAELAGIYQQKGLSASTARLVAAELTEHDALAAHVHAELGLDPEQRINPWHAALASAIAFTLGAALPLLAMYFASPSTRVTVTFVGVIVALGVTGTVSARFGRAHRLRAVLRLLIEGALAMAATWAIGAALGTTTF